MEHVIALLVIAAIVGGILHYRRNKSSGNGSGPGSPGPGPGTEFPRDSKKKR